MADVFVLDLSSYKDRVGARVPKGRYRVVVDDAEMDKSKAGNPMINVWFRILDGEYADQTITDRLTLVDKAMFRVVGFLQAIGVKTPKKRIQLNLNQFVGKVLEIDVEDGEPYNGRVKTEVRGYLKAAKKAGGGVEAVSDLDDLPAEEDPEEEEFTDEEETEGDYADDGDDAEAEEETAEEAAEEEPEPAPVRKKAPAKRKPARKPEPEEDEDDDGTLDLDDLDLD